MINYAELASHILSRAKAIAPERTPKRSQEVLIAWEAALRHKNRYDLPIEAWEEAVSDWSFNHNNQQFSPQALMEAVKRTVDSWQQQPAKRALLEQHRRERMQRRVAAGELPAGTIPELPAGEIETTGDRPGYRGFKDLLGDIRRRNRAHAAAQQQGDEATTAEISDQTPPPDTNTHR